MNILLQIAENTNVMSDDLKGAIITAVATSIISIIGFVVTNKSMKKNFKNEILKQRNEVALNKMAMMPMKILELLGKTIEKHGEDTELSKEFDVSINTIQRDITYLARYYPLETAYGRYGGGVYFEQNWQPYRIYMTPLQERALQHAISSAAAEDVVPLQEILQTFARK